MAKDHYSARRLIGLLVLACVSQIDGMVTRQDSEGPRTVRRVKRPDFADVERQSPWFSNVFEQALIGPRPEAPTDTAERESAPQATTAATTGPDGWSQFVAREAIEDEIKQIHQQLLGQVANASRFNSGIGEIRQHFAMLSMWFGIAHEFDQEIRWKKFAGSAQAVFAAAVPELATANAPAFEFAKRRVEDLGELVRGGVMAAGNDVPEQLVWTAVIDRRTVMMRLDEALGGALRPGTAQAAGFSDRKDDLSRQAHLISAMSEVLIREGMDDADDEGYTSQARAMRAAAADALAGITDDDFEHVAAAVNSIEQSCNKCHGEWR